MHLNDFIEDEDATYDELALDLLNLPQEGFSEVFSLTCLHSNLEELERYIEFAQMAIHQYDNTEKWRVEAGRTN